MWIPKAQGLLIVAVLCLSGCTNFGLEPFNDGGEAGQLRVDPADDLVFDPMPAGAGAGTGELLLAGVGESVVIIQTIEILGGDASVFGLPDLSLPRAVRPGSIFSVNVSFRPPTVGAFVAEVRIAAANSDLEVTRVLRGTGCNDRDNNGECDSGGPPGPETGLDSGR